MRMAQSRPPPVRTYATTSSPPPLSPRTSVTEKKHHSRRKSGNNSERKSSSRPAPLSRKNTAPQYIPSSTKGSSRHREREDEERARDSSGESFPQFCMTCEKQFLPANNTFLYCSEVCRLHDQALPPTSTQRISYSPPLTPYSRQFHPSSYSNSQSTPTHEEGPDIIPRFSPTQSRPRSYFNSDPYPSTSSSSYTPHQTQTQYSTSPPSSTSSALASLRELATALPKQERRRDGRREPESPPKSSASSMSRTGSGVWNYISGSKASTQTPSATPGNSYTTSYSQNQSGVSQSYGGQGGGRSREDLYSFGKSAGGYGASGYGNVVVSGAGYTASGGMGMDRPLPPRSGPGGYGHRPKSIDLVTPFGGH